MNSASPSRRWLLRVLYLLYLVLLAAVGVAVLEWTLRARYAPIRDPFEPLHYQREAAKTVDRLPPEFRVEQIRQPNLRFQVTRTLYGCRHPAALDEVQLAQGEMHTVFLGDSFTHGWGVADDETYGAVYGRLTGTTSHNLICGGYGRGTSYHVDQLRRVLRNEPGLKLVFYQIFGNDLTQDFSARRPPPGGRPSRSVLDHIPMVKAYVLRFGLNVFRRWTGARRDYSNRPEHVYVNFGPVLREEILSQRDRKRWAEDQRLFRQSVAEVMQIARAHELRVVAFVIPYSLRFEPETLESDFLDLTGLVDEHSYQSYLDFVEQVLVGLGAEYFDIEPAFRAAYARDPDRALYIPVDLHLNKEGHRVVGEALAGYLESGG